MNEPQSAGPPGHRFGQALLLGGALLGVVLAVAGLIVEPPASRSVLESSTPDRLPRDAVAGVNGRHLTRSEFDRVLEAELTGGAAPTAAIRQRVLDRMIDEELRTQHGVALNLHLSDPRIRGELATAVAEAAVAAAQYGVDEAHLRSYFETHRHRFARRGPLRVQPIWVAAMEGNLGEAFTRARTATRLLREGNAFALVAEIAGNRPTREVPATALSPEELGNLIGRAALDATLTLAPGDVTEPVRDTAGFHVLRLVERAVIAAPTFESIRFDVEAEFNAEQARQALATQAAQLRRAAIIQLAEVELHRTNGDCGRGNAVWAVGDGRVCSMVQVPRQQPAPAGRLRITWGLSCPEAGMLRIEIALFDDPAAGHVHFATVRDTADPAQRVLTTGDRAWTVRRHGASSTSESSSSAEFKSRRRSKR